MLLSKLLAKFPKNYQNQNTVSVYSFDTPVGKIYGAADAYFLYLLTFEDSKSIEKSFQTLGEKLSCNFIENRNKILTQLEVELEAYFKGSLKKFTIPIKTFGSDFQQLVWKKLRELPYGSTQSYGDVAKALGRAPSHARAIGAACGANSHLFVIPCHRIVASSSKGGFTGGIDRKDWLLDHEKKFVC